MLLRHFTTVYWFLLGVCLLAGYVGLFTNDGSIRNLSNLEVTDKTIGGSDIYGNQHNLSNLEVIDKTIGGSGIYGNHWPSQDRVETIIRSLSQFEPSTVMFPEELSHIDSTNNITKQLLLRLPLEGIDHNPQAVVNDIAKGDTSHFLHGCDATSGVQISTSSNPWVMTSLDLRGNFKTYGGDEYYVTYSFDAAAKSPDAIARVVDMADGTYELYFLQSRSPFWILAQNAVASGVLTINLLYTCAVMLVEPPGKKFWERDGHIHSIWKAGRILPPSFGRFKIEPRRFPELYTAYNFVYAVGNSLMQEISKRQNVLHMSVGASLNTLTLKQRFMPVIKRAKDPQVQQEKSKLYGIIQENRSAFILGSCIWDLASNYDQESFELLTKKKGDSGFGFYELKDHLKAIRIYVREVRHLFPGRPIYWKGCTAVHRHMLDPTKMQYLRGASWQGTKEKIYSILYASLVRGRHLDVAQKKLMEELNVPVIDMFDMTYEMAELHKPNDVMHYIPEAQNYLVDYFFPVDKQLSTDNVTFDIIRQ